jgi:uncharacterized protein (TIGR00369 family)
VSAASAGDAVGASPYLRGLGLRVEHVVPERARVRIPYRDGNANAGGVLHGGVIASAIDAAGMLVARAGPAPAADVEQGTLDLTVSYLAPAIGEDIVAEARLLRRGREIVYADVEARTDVGKPVARGLLTYRIAPAGRRARRSDVMPAAPPSTERSALADLLASSPFIARLGIRVTHAGAGLARLTLPAGDATRAADGTVHEGALATLLDTAGATAAWSLVPLDPRVRASTIGIHVSLHAPAQGDVAAEARVLHRRNEIVANRVTLGAGGQVVATGAVTYRIVPPEP